MVMTLERPVVESAVRRGLPGSAEAGRAIMSALMRREAATFTIEVDSASRVREFASPLRMFLLVSGREAGGVSVTVAPHFAEQTYPAMVDLVGRLDGAGASDLWRPDGARSVALGEARQMFISADMPLAERSPRPDRLVEVVSADSLPAEWYRTRVAPRLAGRSPVRVFYGLQGASGSAFAEADAEAMAEEAITGELRRFSIVKTGA